MKLFVVACLLTAAAAAPGSPAKTAALRALPALEHQEIHDEFGQYALRYVTAEGTIVSARGRLVPNAHGKACGLITEGEYSFIGDDGKTYVTKYSDGPDGNHYTATHFSVDTPLS